MKKSWLAVCMIAILVFSGCTNVSKNKPKTTELKREKFGVTLSYKENGIKEVLVGGEIAGETPIKMTKTGPGQFSTNIFRELGKYRYYFIVDGVIKKDSASKVRIEKNSKGEMENYVVVEAKAYKRNKNENLKGKIEKVEIYNQKRGKNLSANIYTPFNMEKGKKYPVLIIIHGYTQTEDNFRDIGIQKYADFLIEKNIIKPMIIAMPHIDAQIDENQNFVKAITAEMYKDVVIDDLMGYLAKNYPVTESREERVISGGSMGGMLSFDFALTYPEYFGKTIPIMGLFDIERIDKNIELNGKPEFDITLYCGREDSLISYNQELSRLLDRHGVAHRYNIREGGHTAEYEESIMSSVLLEASEFVSRME